MAAPFPKVVLGSPQRAGAMSDLAVLVVQHQHLHVEIGSAHLHEHEANITAVRSLTGCLAS